MFETRYNNKTQLTPRRKEMAKNKQQLIESMIRNIKEMLDRKYCGLSIRKDERLLDVYAVALAVLEKQKEGAKEPIKLEEEFVSDSNFYKTQEALVAKGFTVVDDTIDNFAYGLAFRVLKKLDPMLFDYYYREKESADNEEFYNGECYDDFIETFKGIVSNDFKTVSFGTRWCSSFGFKPSKEFEMIKKLDGYLFHSTKTKRIY